MSFTNKRFYLNFNLEVLHGCKWSCGGCHVNTTGQLGFAAGDLDRFISLTNDFSKQAYQPSLIVVGPTDVFSAKNTLDVLQDPKFQEFVAPYVRLTFNTTFLDISDEVIECLNKFYSDKELEFKIIIEAAQFMNDKYLTRVQENMNSTRAKLICKKMPVHPQFNLFDYRITKLNTVLENYEALNERSYDFFDQGIDYVLSFSRSDTITKENKLQMLLWIQKTFNKHVSLKNAEYIHFDAGNLVDFEEHIFTYRNGLFYFSPKVYDEYVAFDAELSIPVKDWTAQEFETFEHKMIVDQYEKLHNKPCATCHYAPTCVNRGMPFFMDYMNTNGCIVPKDAYDIINLKAPA